MLPNFVYAGTEKAGATPPFPVLEQHRDVFEALLRRLYREEFKDKIGRLEKFLGRDLVSWRHG